MKSHQEIAAPYKEATHAVSAKTLAEIIATDNLFSARTGFEVDGLEQAVPARVLRGLGRAATFNIVELMAVTDEPGRDDSLLHGATVAALTGGNVILGGNVGVEYDAYSVMEDGQLNKLTKDQRGDLKKGNFDMVAKASANAAMEAMEREGLEDLDTYVVAPSLAGNIAAAGIGHMIERGMNLRGVSMIDPVGLSPKPGMGRIAEFFKVNGSAAEYLDANHPLRQEIGEAAGMTGIKEMVPWLKRSLNSIGPNLLYGYHGIGKGDGRTDLLRQADAMHQNNVRLRIYAAGNSEFGTVPAAERTIEELKRIKVDADLNIIDGASHAISMMAAMHAEAVNGFRLKK